MLSSGRQRHRVGRFLDETLDDRPLSGFDHTETTGLVRGHPYRRHRGRGPGFDVLDQHLAWVHAVDVVRAEHQYVLWALVADDVQVLVNGIGRAREPPWPPPHLGRHRRYVTTQQRGEPPGTSYVEVEAVAFVLRQDDNLREPGVGQVGQGKVDETVVTAKRHGRFGPVESEGEQPLALSARQDYRENSSHSTKVAQPRPVVPFC